MAEPTPNEQSGEPHASAAGEKPRRRPLTPEQRRLLNTPRTFPPNESRVSPTPEREKPSVDDIPEPAAPSSEKQEALAADPPPERRQGSARMANVVEQSKASRALEMRHAIVVISALILLAAIFFAGRKFDAIKYHLMTRLKAPEIEEGVKKFPGLSADELIESALAAEKRGDWQEAADRFLAAKIQNRAIPGILFRIGKGAYDRNDFAAADPAFDHAIRFGENIPTSNYYRGLIATRRHDLPAATRFFEAAANAEPFAADFFYFWGEALRLDHHPREAIKRFEQAFKRTPNPTDAILCQFKIRLARIEAVEGTKVNEELDEMRKTGPLPVDWIMTEAALQLQAGNIPQVVQLISQAKEKGVTGLFVTCAGDTVFLQAAAAHPEIAELIATSTKPVE